jgi:hypothetical protein
VGQNGQNGKNEAIAAVFAENRAQHWPKGTSGNIRGRAGKPRRIISNELEKLLKAKPDGNRTRAHALAARLIAIATEDEYEASDAIRAAVAIMDRLEGRPDVAVTVDGSANVTAAILIAAQIARGENQLENGGGPLPELTGDADADKGAES